MILQNKLRNQNSRTNVTFHGFILLNVAAFFIDRQG